MAISSLGIGSGLNVNDIISQLTALEKQPLVALQTKAADIQAKISSVGTISSQMSALNDAAFNLSLDSAWAGVTASSGNTSAVSVTANSTAKPTSFSVSVSQLARAQSTASTAVVKDAQIGTGSLTIDIGSWDFGTTDTPTVPPVFTQGSASSINISIGPGENTLSGIATKINNANAGVTATILEDVTGQRLLIRSNATGAAAGFRIQATDDDGDNTDSAGLSSLAFDPGTAASNGASSFGMGDNGYQQATNAVATINSVVVQSATNTITDAVPGVTLKLGAVTTQPTNVDVTVDSTTITKNIQALVDAYNALNSTLADATKYDDATKTAGTLQGDSVIVGLQNALRSMMTSLSGSTGAFKNLASIGITMQLGGALSVDSNKLSNAISSNLTDLKSLFTLNTGDAGTNGIARKAKDFATSALSVTGLITNETNALQGQSDANQKDQDSVNAHADAVAAQLKATYSALDVQMGSLTALNQFVTQQIAQWNK